MLAETIKDTPPLSSWMRRAFCLACSRAKKLPYLDLCMTIKRIAILSLAAILVAAATFTQAAMSAKAKKASTATTHAKPVSIAKNPYLGAIVVNAADGTVLFQDNPDAKGYPASVLKLMDLLVILEKIEAHQIALTDSVPVSAKAAKTGGSQVWLAEKEVFTVDEMLYALMIQSANDAAVALAEKVGGTTDGFVQMMNARAQSLGMTSTVFHSVHGLPPSPGQPNDETTARDLALLCRELLKHQDTLRYTSARDRVFRPGSPHEVNMHNHDHLLGNVQGCDGFKTGYITRAGFSIAITAARNGQRVIVVVLDSTDRKLRDAKAAELVAKGFAALPALPPAAVVPVAAPAGTPVVPPLSPATVPPAQPQPATAR